MKRRRHMRLESAESAINQVSGRDSLSERERADLADAAASYCTGGITRLEFIRRAAITGISASSLSALLAACGGEEGAAPPSGEEPMRGGRLRFGTIGEGQKETLDPHVHKAGTNIARSENLFERLVAYKPDLTYEYRLAESLEPNADATRWQLKVRPDVTFHDGKPLTADDVLYSLQRVGSSEEFTANADVDPIDFDATKKVDDLTIDLVLKRPVGDLALQFLAFGLPIIPDGTTSFDPPVGTGPFKFASWKRGERSLFEKNENYWQDGVPLLDELEIISFDDPAATFNALRTGELDAINTLGADQAQAHKNSQEIQVVEVPNGVDSPYYMRLDQKPFSDPRVRQALRLSIDRQAALDAVYFGDGEPGNDLFGRGFPSYNDELPQREYDPEKAAALLKEAGQEGLTVTLTAADAEPGSLGGAIAWADQAKAAGITIELDQIPPEEIYNTDRYYLKVPFGPTGWPTSFPFELVALRTLLEVSPWTETAWHRPEWDAEFQRAQGTPDPDERNRIYKELQVPLWEEGGYVVWAYAKEFYATAPNLRGMIVMQASGSFGDYNFRPVGFAEA